MSGATAQEEVAIQSMKPEPEKLLPVTNSSQSHRAMEDLTIPTGQPQPAAEAGSEGPSDDASVTQVPWTEVPGVPGGQGGQGVPEVPGPEAPEEVAAASARSTPGLLALLVVGGDGTVALDLTFDRPLSEGDAAADAVTEASARLRIMGDQLLNRPEMDEHKRQAREIPLPTHP